MNILQILPSLDVGGVETGTVDLARALAAMGHKAIVVSSGGRLVKALDEAGVRHYGLPVGKKSLLNVIRMTRRLARIIRAEDIDIVHARSRVPALIAYFACRMTDRKFITTAHGYYRKHPLSEVMGWGRRVIVASNIMAKHMMNDFGVPFDRIRLIPRGVDLSRFKFRDPKSYASNGLTVGMVSRITPLKGHLDFIRACAILMRKVPRLKVVIVGEAPKEKYRDELTLLVKRLGMSSIVEFAGSKGDIPSVMAGLDVLVSATVTQEAFGRSVVEAQASGVPVVATSVGGVVDIVEDGRTGLLCPAQDPEAMAERIYRLYKDRELWVRLAENSRRSVEENYTLDKMVQRTVALYEETVKSLNILVIKMSALGDVILSVPSLRAIRAKYPDAVIKVLTGLKSREALDNCPYIDERIVCDLESKDKTWGAIWRIGEALRKECFDIVIDLQNNRKSHLLAFLSMAHLRYGYDNGKWSFLLNRKIKDDAPFLDPIEHQFRTLKMAGINPDDKSLEIWPSPSDDEAVSKLLDENWIKPGQELVGINIRASERWFTKNWPPAYIAELCDILARERNVRVVLTGSRSDAGLAAEIAKRTKSKPVIAAGRTGVLELAGLIKRCSVFITPDSAPLHIAAAVKTPLIAFFGPTDPSRHMPPAGNAVVMKRELKCAPCYSPHCIKDFRCMKGITPIEVFGEIKNMMKLEPV